MSVKYLVWFCLLLNLLLCIRLLTLAHILCTITRWGEIKECPNDTTYKNFLVFPFKWSVFKYNLDFGGYSYVKFSVSFWIIMYFIDISTIIQNLINLIFFFFNYWKIAYMNQFHSMPFPRLLLLLLTHIKAYHFK